MCNINIFKTFDKSSFDKYVKKNSPVFYYNN